MNSKPVANTVFVIAPYVAGGTWMFDDPDVGLVREPFVAGIPEMIDVLIEGIPNGRRGFRLLFSAQPFPGYQVELVQVRHELGGAWYRWVEHDREGWLCPALLKYFRQAPANLYCRAESV